MTVQREERGLHDDRSTVRRSLPLVMTELARSPAAAAAADIVYL